MICNGSRNSDMKMYSGVRVVRVVVAKNNLVVNGWR